MYLLGHGDRVVREPGHRLSRDDKQGDGVVCPQLRRGPDDCLVRVVGIHLHHHLAPSLIPERSVSGPPVQTGIPCIGSPFPQTAASNSSLSLLAFTLLQSAGVVISRTGDLTSPLISPFWIRYASR